MPALLPPDEEEVASQTNLTPWGRKVGYEPADREEIGQLAALPFLTYPETPLLSKKLSVATFPQVSAGFLSRRSVVL